MNLARSNLPTSVRYEFIFVTMRREVTSEVRLVAGGPNTRPWLSQRIDLASESLHC